MILYFLHTFNKLPPSKWVMKDPHTEVREILSLIVSQRPRDFPLPFNRKQDVRDSAFMTKIDTCLVPDWRNIFIERRNFDWTDLLKKAEGW